MGFDDIPRRAPADGAGGGSDGVSGRDVAVIGAGVSGLTAAYVLSRANRVTLFEAEGRLGGHAHTHVIRTPGDRELGVDSGFIVHNTATYPMLTRLFSELGIATQASEMSMSVRCAGCGLQYAGNRGPGGLAAGYRRGGRRYLRMLTEIPAFHRDARRLLAEGGGPVTTFGEFLAAGGYSGYFITHFAMPFVAAVWSCAPGTTLSYPARYLFAFLSRHGLLSATGSPPWRTVTGGSARYVERAAARLAAVRAGVPVRAVRRFAGGAEVRDEAGRAFSFDGVVIATHPDQALRLLADPSKAEREVLGAFRYSRNQVLLHTDARVLPSSPRARASWNYLLRSCAAGDVRPLVSYDMNRLQRLPSGRDHIVTLNGADLVDPGRVLATMQYAHPVYEPASVAAQQWLPGLNDYITAYAGAYHGWGFHEDGCRSGVAAARALGARW